MSRRPGLILCAIIIFIASFGGAFAEERKIYILSPFVKVFPVEGNVSFLTGDSKGEWKKLNGEKQFFGDDRIYLEKGSKVKIVFPDGEIEQLPGETELVFLCFFATNSKFRTWFDSNLTSFILWISSSLHPQF